MTFEFGGSATVVCFLLVVALGGWLAVGLRHRFLGWRWWQIASFLAGCTAVAAAVLTRLESLGREDLLTAHVAQHIVLGDVAAPLLLLGLPPQTRGWLRTRLARVSISSRQPVRMLAWVLSPLGALVVWAVAAYAWYTPQLHRLTVADGSLHALDHLSFLLLGMLIWLGALDPREPQSVRRGLRDGGLPWWARHVYAVCSRVAMVPAAAVLWLASGYHEKGRLPLRYSRAEDQVNAASLLIGFEMVLFASAFVLGFVFLARAEGARLAAQGPDVPPSPPGGAH